MNRFIRLLALSFVGAAAAGCSMPLTNGPDQAVNIEKTYPITVEPQVATLVVQVDEGLQSLARGEEPRVQAFVERWKMRGQGVLNAAAPSGTPNQAAAGAAIEQLKKALAENGVPQSSVQFTSYRAAGDDAQAPITLSFVTYAASAQECGSNWTESLSFTPRNTPWPEFGCSTQHNFAAIVAEPRDLIEPRTSDPVDASRRTTVLGHYREGMPTRTADESTKDSGAVSTVNK
ncbi:MAG: CpaD family pilus assembly protein [Alphaproteobacteria bacterium]|nr:CpaD family pilus assembly protein [Alphaproteobacteria bacterium]